MDDWAGRQCEGGHGNAAVDPMRRRLTGLLAWLGLGAPAPVLPQTRQKLGIVLLHGIGADGASLAPLAEHLRAPGWLVATPDMPWSKAGAFSEPVGVAEGLVRDALARLRRDGAQRLVLAGFSIGGFFAARMAGQVPVDALVAIAPNGGSDMKKLDDQLAKARDLVAQGKGQERTTLMDADVASPARWPLEGTRPAAYLDWYDPQGAMNWDRAWRALRPGVPVLLVVPTRDLANLRERKAQLWSMLPPHPANALLEPRSDHIGAPAASADGVVRWLGSTLL
jgi:pimeloyl-ACP methyl ester carboxylesterase